jgi:hypothetical protein
MGRSVVLIDVDVLAEHLPMIRQAARVIGSAAREAQDDSIALLVEGDAVPDCPQCLVEVQRVSGQTCVQLTLRFKPVDQAPNAPLFPVQNVRGR